MGKKTKAKSKLVRNNRLYDKWSLVHLSTGILMGWLINPVIGLGLMIIYEPFEILILSPFLKRFNIVFGYETIRNSLSDIVFDSLGIAIGFYAFTSLANPPFHLF